MLVQSKIKSQQYFLCRIKNCLRCTFLYNFDWKIRFFASKFYMVTLSSRDWAKST